jgi:glycerophosphoryl diester phosphodiesterase
VWVIGHRGASSAAPENTLASFRLAVQAGAQAIETDLQLSRDGRLLILHDDKLQRTTNARGPVAAKTLDELRCLDAGSWFPKRRLRKRAAAPPPFAGERVPTLEEALDFGRDHNIRLYLEMKAPRGRGAEPAVAAAIAAAGARSRVHVICFDLRVLARVREIDPSIPLGYLFSRPTPHAVDRALRVGADTILPRANRVTARLIAQAARRDLKVVTWTVNSPRQMKQLISMGLDGIMTDFPARLASLLADH